MGFNFQLILIFFINYIRFFLKKNIEGINIILVEIFEFIRKGIINVDITFSLVFLVKYSAKQT